MFDFVYNPRRAPRALIRCDAQVVRASGGTFSGPTVDLGPSGCQVVTPVPLPPGERLVITLRDPDVAGAATLRGRVVWTAGEAPFRSGVHFDAESGDASALLYCKLAAAHPDFVEVDEVPDRLPLTARVVPWRREEDAAVLPREEEVLLAIGEGARIDELQERLGDRWEAAVNPLFALLARRLLVVESEAR